MGIKISEHVTKKFNATSNRLFRPLAGIKVSELKLAEIREGRKASFPSPLGD